MRTHGRGRAAWAAWRAQGLEAWPTKAAILALSLALQVGFWVWLRAQDVSMTPRAPERILELVLVDTAPRLRPSLPPLLVRRAPRRSLRAVRIDPPAVPTTTLDPLALLPGRPLSSQLPGIGTSLGEPDAEIGVLDPLHPRAARLPGRDTAIVHGFHVRRERSPDDIVRLVGGFLFGGNYDPCPDLVGKTHDATIAHPERYSDAERRALIERERGCRY